MSFFIATLLVTRFVPFHCHSSCHHSSLFSLLLFLSPLQSLSIATLLITTLSLFINTLLVLRSVGRNNHSESNRMTNKLKRLRATNMTTKVKRLRDITCQPNSKAVSRTRLHREIAQSNTKLASKLLFTLVADSLKFTKKVRWKCGNSTEKVRYWCNLSMTD